MKEGVYTLPVLHALPRGPAPGRARTRSWPAARRRASGCAGARDRADGWLASSTPGTRSRRPRWLGRSALASQLPDGPADHWRQTQLARFLAVRCGADAGGGRQLHVGAEASLLGYGRASRKRARNVETYYGSYGVVSAVLVAGPAGRRGLHGCPAHRPPAAQPGGKLTTYECGIDPVGEGWSQTQIRYYIYAFLFVIFDVESVFLFPWARCSSGSGYPRSWRWPSSSGSSASACSTRGGRGCSSGPDRSRSRCRGPAGQVPPELGPASTRCGS